jgi:hypothetical protein
MGATVDSADVVVTVTVDEAAATAATWLAVTVFARPCVGLASILLMWFIVVVSKNELLAAAASVASGVVAGGTPLVCNALALFGARCVEDKRWEEGLTGDGIRGGCG